LSLPPGEDSQQVLGADFTIKASIGHVKDLPKKDIGVDVENNFTPTYVVIEGKEKVMKDLRRRQRLPTGSSSGPTRTGRERPLRGILLKN